MQREKERFKGMIYKIKVRIQLAGVPDLVGYTLMLRGSFRRDVLEHFHSLLIQYFYTDALKDPIINVCTLLRWEGLKEREFCSSLSHTFH
jgi:hypothetical protein